MSVYLCVKFQVSSITPTSFSHGVILPPSSKETPKKPTQIMVPTWSSTCVITHSTGARRCEITDTKLYVPVVTLSTQDNAKLLQQLKSGFKRTINWNKY